MRPPFSFHWETNTSVVMWALITARRRPSELSVGNQAKERSPGQLVTRVGLPVGFPVSKLMSMAQRLVAKPLAGSTRENRRRLSADHNSAGSNSGSVGRLASEIASEGVPPEREMVRIVGVSSFRR